MGNWSRTSGHETFEKAYGALSEKCDDSAVGREIAVIRLMFKYSVPQWERETIGERTRDALQHKIRKGERLRQGPIRVPLVV